MYRIVKCTLSPCNVQCVTDTGVGWLCKAREISGALLGIIDHFKLGFEMPATLALANLNEHQLRK